MCRDEGGFLAELISSGHASRRSLTKRHVSCKVGKNPSLGESFGAALEPEEERAKGKAKSPNSLEKSTFVEGGISGEHS